jgi:hypothetical protein
MYPPFRYVIGGFGSGIWQAVFIAKASINNGVDLFFLTDAAKLQATSFFGAFPGVPYPSWASFYGLTAGGWGVMGAGRGYG